MPVLFFEEKTMATYPDNLGYTKDHEWLRMEGDAAYVGDSFEISDPFGSVESVKSVNELFIPVSGEILEINEALADAPELVNNDPYRDGWMIKIKVVDTTEVDGLLSAVEYEDFVKEQE
jgi:glycine cleavage system H protein